MNIKRRYKLLAHADFAEAQPDACSSIQASVIGSQVVTSSEKLMVFFCSAWCCSGQHGTEAGNMYNLLRELLGFLNCCNELETKFSDFLVCLCHSRDAGK